MFIDNLLFYDDKTMTILDRIIADTRDLVARRKRDVTPRDLEDRAYFRGPTLPLADALRQPALSVIAEIKKASPSQGVIREKFDVAEIARQYKSGGAAALSVLTEPQYFQGSLDHLATARQTVDLPLLRKDFVIDPYQLYEARAYGADAVLLIATALDRYQLYDLHQAADELGLSCLVELYDIRELDRIDFDQVQILGVNNRNLHTFEVNIENALEVFSAVPTDAVRVAESGLKTAEALAHVRTHGVDAVLIGEAFMRAEEPGEALAMLVQETSRLLHAEPVG